MKKLLDTLTNKSFWETEFPKLSINQSLSGKTVEFNSLNKEKLDMINEQVNTEGYFQEHDGELKEIATVLSEAVITLADIGLPPVFIFVFDEAWRAFYRQHAILQRLLNEKYFVLPDFWVWHVDPLTQESGWRPHRDKDRFSLRPDGSPQSLSVWIPLTEATPLNGCIYIVPADRDSVYNTEQERYWDVDLGDVRALPAVPGDVLGWNQAILHWGAKANKRAPIPRISMAMEFQRTDIPPYNTPLMDPFSDVEFDMRLKLIGKQILQYQHMYPLTEFMAEFAKKLTSENAPKNRSAIKVNV